MKPAFKNCVFDNSETATCSLEDDGYQLPVEQVDVLLTDECQLLTALIPR